MIFYYFIFGDTVFKLNVQLGASALETLRLVTLGLHVFSVQFGLQTLPGQLTDILLPSSVKAVLKGVIRALLSLSLIVFVTIFRQLPDFSFAFLVMSGCLLLACPVLWLRVPELRNLGRDCGEHFFLPAQTIFFAVLPSNAASSHTFRKLIFAVKYSSQLVILHWKSWQVIAERRRELGAEGIVQISCDQSDMTF